MTCKHKTRDPEDCWECLLGNDDEQPALHPTIDVNDPDDIDWTYNEYISEDIPRE